MFRKFPIFTLVIAVGVLTLASLPAIADTSPVLGVGTVSGQAGSSVILPVSFTAGTTGVVSLQFDLQLPSGITYGGSVAAGASASSGEKAVAGAPLSGGVRVIVGGLNQTPLSSGDLADITLAIPAGAASGEYTITPSNVVFSDANADAVSSTVAGGSITVTGGSVTTVATSTAPSTPITTGGGSGYGGVSIPIPAPVATTTPTSSLMRATSTVSTMPTTTITLATSSISSTTLTTTTDSFMMITDQLVALEQELVELEFNHHGCPATFSENLSLGSSGPQVHDLQTVLNYTFATQVAEDGTGSPSEESGYFDPATEAAVMNFQNIFSAQILTPEGLSVGTGIVGPATRAELNALCR